MLPCDPGVRRKDLQHFALVINGTPEIMRLFIDPDEPRPSANAIANMIESEYDVF